jgi:uroporphyrin-III C-methyltransferase/precorrin-2 dehydrogenase/sirohydrochlorin ferrochelatase
MSQANAGPRSYPAFLRLQGRSALVVGAGPVAAQKLQGLLDAGARVTVVAPAIHPAFDRPEVERLQRGFTESDLAGRWLVVAAAPPEVNAAVARAAEERQIFVNAVDDLASASVHLGGVVERGGVTFAISTGARAPALAGLLREAVEALLPEEIGDWVALAEELKHRWRAAGVPIHERRPLLLAALLERHSRRSAA